MAEVCGELSKEHDVFGALCEGLIFGLTGVEGYTFFSS